MTVWTHTHFYRYGTIVIHFSPDFKLITVWYHRALQCYFFKAVVVLLPTFTIITLLLFSIHKHNSYIKYNTANIMCVYPSELLFVYVTKYFNNESFFAQITKLYEDLLSSKSVHHTSPASPKQTP